MAINEPVAALPSSSAFHGATLVVDADFETRWTAWVARGRVHERRARRRFVVSAAVIAIGAAAAWAFLA